MNANISEKIFQDYLEENNLEYKRDVVVNNRTDGKNVDFLVKTPMGKLLFDVKEVHDSPRKSNNINADKHIRDDIKDLRRKFGKIAPKYPVFLITMNFTSKPFSAFSVAQAMFGDIGIIFNSQGDFSDIHHLYKGNASLSDKKNTSISGVLAFDIDLHKHVMMLNPFSTGCFYSQYFSNLQVLNLNKENIHKNIKSLSSIMLWPHSTTERNIPPSDFL